MSTRGGTLFVGFRQLVLIGECPGLGPRLRSRCRWWTMSATPHRKDRHIMKAAYIEKFGGPEVLTYGDLPDPTAGPGQIVVDTVAVSINAADWKVCAGEYGGQAQVPDGPGARLLRRGQRARHGRAGPEGRRRGVRRPGRRPRWNLLREDRDRRRHRREEAGEHDAMSRPRRSPSPASPRSARSRTA